MPERIAVEGAKYAGSEKPIVGGRDNAARPVFLINVPSDDCDTPIWTAITIQARVKGARLPTDRSIVRAVVTWTVIGGKQTIVIDVPREAAVNLPSGLVEVSVYVAYEELAAQPPPPVTWIVSAHVAAMPITRAQKAFISYTFDMDALEVIDVPIVQGCTDATLLGEPAPAAPFGTELATLGAYNIDGVQMYSQLFPYGIPVVTPLPAAGAIEGWRIIARTAIHGKLLQYLGP